MGDNFYMTRMGAKFYNSDIPSLVKNLGRLADAQEEANRLKMMELSNNDVDNGTGVVMNVTPFNIRKSIWYDYSDFNMFISLMFDKKYIAVCKEDNKFEFQTINGENRNTSSAEEVKAIYEKLEEYYGGAITINDIHCDNKFGVWIYYTEKKLLDEFK